MKEYLAENRNEKWLKRGLTEPDVLDTHWAFLFSDVLKGTK
jgi:hypothetical protein